ncbi:MAG TPA: hypothetical protein VFS05_03845 [Gemmatimonadaceae bacterium]|nr:hypothetical protein [Gemmatimonadaceae bacterium]
MYSRLVAAFAALAVVAALAPERAEAQRRPAQQPRRQTIEIRGQVPTPQVVTVRPREVPVVSRQVLVPNFYDRSFWPAVEPGYELVPREEVTGSAVDTIAPPVAVSAPSAQPGPTITPTPMPPAQRAAPAAAPLPATSIEELEAIRRELQRRDARLDSLQAKIRQQFTPPDTTGPLLPPAQDTTTRRPPKG